MAWFFGGDAGASQQQQQQQQQQQLLHLLTNLNERLNDMDERLQQQTEENEELRYVMQTMAGLQVQAAQPPLPQAQPPQHQPQPPQHQPPQHQPPPPQHQPPPPQHQPQPPQHQPQPPQHQPQPPQHQPQPQPPQHQPLPQAQQQSFYGSPAVLRISSGELTPYAPIVAPQSTTSPTPLQLFEAGAKAMASIHAKLTGFAESINRSLVTLDREERVDITDYERMPPALAYITLNNLNEDLKKEVRNKKSRQSYDTRRRLNMALQRGMLRSAELDRFTADAAAPPPPPPEY
jgi:hypothetical protein